MTSQALNSLIQEKKIKSDVGIAAGGWKTGKIRHTVVLARKVISEMRLPTSKTRCRFCDGNAQKLPEINQTKIEKCNLFRPCSQTA